MVDIKTVEKVAKLARIGLTEDEKQPLTEQLSKVIETFEVLSKVNTDNVEPMTSVSGELLTERADKITDGNVKEQILNNAPKAEFDCFLVPKVIDQG